ncbi:hypothetical protein PIB30_015065 [Stylosanthes scabra]|uniref:Uncharacterized protein n=1 Tax=Stylosanthes scabra TaxID=79078 RepID=A0ABU6Q7M4_9FABA|nr:hypothetical protein [Stylosanthes scabra]
MRASRGAETVTSSEIGFWKLSKPCNLLPTPDSGKEVIPPAVFIKGEFKHETKGPGNRLGYSNRFYRRTNRKEEGMRLSKPEIEYVSGAFEKDYFGLQPA